MEEEQRTSKVIIVTGLPASGKTTCAEEIVSNCENIVRVDADSIRFMLHPNYYEKIPLVCASVPNTMVVGIVDLLRKKKVDIVIECSLDHLTDYEKWLRGLEDVEVQVISMTTPIKVCIKRNRQRSPTRRGPDSKLYRIALHQGVLDTQNKNIQTLSREQLFAFKDAPRDIGGKDVWLVFDQDENRMKTIEETVRALGIDYAAIFGLGEANYDKALDNLRSMLT